MIKTVIVQAGGLGSRLQYYTWNKPKCLLPLDGKPLLYHWFDKFPNSKFIIIVDYLSHVVEDWLKCFPPYVDFDIIKTSQKGTCAGLSQALDYLPEGMHATVLTWCDLFPANLEISQLEFQNQSIGVAVTNDFACRWSWHSQMQHISSDNQGICGLFTFCNKDILQSLPEHGEFVSWLSQENISCHKMEVQGLQEFGTLSDVQLYYKTQGHARFFNNIEILDTVVVKQSKFLEYNHLIKDEIQWYKHARELGIKNIPTVQSLQPLTLSKIHGSNPDQLEFSTTKRSKILDNICQALDAMHSLEKVDTNNQDTWDMYVTKTHNRVKKLELLRPDLLQRDSIKINGIMCKNILHEKYSHIIAERFNSLKCDHFAFIHGDPTFCNTIVDNNNKAWWIDPRGSFGSTKLHGDPDYDWAKLYYSVVGQYDFFNKKLFCLEEDSSQVEVRIQANGWQHLQPMLEEKLQNKLIKVKILHALVWLSLVGYVQDDYDSILASFYQGLFYLETSC
jgi:GTP:adenosylcobinamide-phosphate guanylyltransferase/aminoglycoside phosphotransferase